MGSWDWMSAIEMARIVVKRRVVDRSWSKKFISMNGFGVQHESSKMGPSRSEVRNLVEGQ